MLLAHPKFEHSVVNRTLIQAISSEEGVLVRDLYELYPDFNVDVQVEQELLFMHEVVIWHHPIYWYSAPPLLKQWIDLVLEFGWAYGPGGIFLKNKLVLNAVSSGGTQEAYSEKGRNRRPLRDYLLPFEQTAGLCNMRYLPPFTVPGTHRIGDDQLAELASRYQQLVTCLRDDPAPETKLMPYADLNQFNN